MQIIVNFQDTGIKLSVFKAAMRTHDIICYNLLPYLLDSSISDLEHSNVVHALSIVINDYRYKDFLINQ